MTESPAPPASEARGFLFADLRGYTAFAEAEGDQAAADLLSTYRAVVREVIPRFEGAEIRTEGDSFYVVFRSASSAIRAGLEILDRATGAAPGRRPIRVAIGVHAGEATQTAEGYVGSAVNVAARICAAAGAGELLVTDTVRALTRGQVAFRFEQRGRRRLKGVAEPVALFAVTSADAPIQPRRRSDHLRDVLGRGLSWRLAFPAVLALGVLVLTAGAIALIGRDFGGSAGEAPTPAPLAATTSASPSATDASLTPQPDPDAEREAANERLAARIDPGVARHCTSADPDEAPLNIEYFLVTEYAIPTVAGLRCDLGGGQGPDVAYFWLASQERPPQTSRDVSAQGAFFYLAGKRNLPPGDCSSESRAWGPWEFGSSRGLLLCSGFGGEALLMWTYEGTTILAEATREDGDGERLYRWWEDHARTLGPQPSS